MEATSQTFYRNICNALFSRNREIVERVATVMEVGPPSEKQADHCNNTKGLHDWSFCGIAALGLQVELTARVFSLT